ncbi:hypothetical protein [Solicola sp. PLA-1-18]|uniref:hypothetical protein n=1 Tax=Solicola sp. PLA-1-18 TaxID=3380532 RepID=UPI003B7DA175
MKTNSIARVAARVTVVGATAVALTLGSTSLAGASDSTTGSATLTSDAPTTASAGARKAVTSMSVTNGVLSSKSGTTISAAVGGSPKFANASRIAVPIRKGSKRLGTFNLSISTGRGSFTYYNGYGRGARQVGPLYYYAANGAYLGSENVNRTFYVRSAVKGKLKVRSTGSSKRAKANVKIWSSSKKKYISAKRVKLQVLSGGTWRTKKTIKLNKKGTGYYSFRSSSKKKYRVLIKTTSTIQGAKTRGIRI